MNAVLRGLKGTGAFAVLVGLIAGIPWGLVYFMGWPLRTTGLSVSSVSSALGQSGVSDSLLLGGLAIALWLLWLAFALAVGAESLAAAHGGVARHVVGGPFQMLAASLVGVIVMSLSSAVSSSSNEPRVDLLSVVQPMPPVALATATGAVVTLPTASASPVVKVQQPEYVVVRHDTLWGISERFLGNPQRWREIFQLNEGRVQSDGRSLVDGDRIYPGWRLALPSDASVVSPVVQESTAVSTVAITPPTSEPEVSVANVVPTQLGDRTAPSSAEAGQALRARSGPVEPTSGPVSGDSAFIAGSVVGASLGFAISGALARIKTRRRRRYVPGEVAPGVAMVGAAETGRVEHLIDLQVSDEGLDEEIAVTREPGEVAVGVVDGNEIVVDVSRAGATVLHGPDALAETRNVVVSFVASHDSDQAEVVVVGESLADRLVGSARVPGISVVENVDAALRGLDIEALRRRRLMDESEVTDVVELRNQLPGEALPASIIVTQTGTDASKDHLRLLGERGRALGIGVILVADNEDEGDVVDRLPGIGSVGGVEMFRLNKSDASAVIDVLDDARTFDDEGVVYPAIQTEDFEVAPTAHAVDRVRLSVMGVERIAYRGEEVRSGLRRSAWELAAFLSLRPRGATKDAVIEAIWPNRKRVAADDLFRVSLSNLRQTLRTITGQSEAQFVEFTNERYRFDRLLIECDLWEFERLLDVARGASAERLRGALERVVASYEGAFVDGASYGWAEEVREDLRNRVLDSISKLVDLAEADGDDELALDRLEKAIEIEPYAEELYLWMMRIQARLRRRDAVARTMRRLERALEDLGLEARHQTRTEFRALLG